MVYLVTEEIMQQDIAVEWSNVGRMFYDVDG